MREKWEIGGNVQFREKSSTRLDVREHNHTLTPISDPTNFSTSLFFSCQSVPAFHLG